jgi:hypothetical protein
MYTACKIICETGSISSYVAYFSRTAVHMCRAQPPARFRKPHTVVLVHQNSKIGGYSALMRGVAVQFADRGFLTVMFGWHSHL